MIKRFSAETCAFDCEWVPCADAGRRLLNLDSLTGEREIFEALWQTYAEKAERDRPPSGDEPARPFLKLALCRVISIAAIFRTVNKDGSPSLELYSRAIDEYGEGQIIGDFLERVAYEAPKKGYQLWGYNSGGSDLPILKQRAIALGVRCPNFSRRPERPWEGLDYHDGRSEAHVDILQAVGNFGRGGLAYPKLKEFAAACGIPCKFDIEGSDIAGLYLEGKIQDIARYNEVDAIVTHLLMLKIAYHACHLSAAQYRDELQALETLVEERANAGCQPLAQFLSAWRAIRPDEPVPAVIEEVSRTRPAVPTTVPPRDDETTLIRSGMDQVLAQLKVNHHTKAAAILLSRKDISVDGDRVLIAFASDRQCNVAEADENRPHILAAFEHLLGRSLTCECQIGDHCYVRA